MATTQNTGAYKGIGKAHSPLLQYTNKETNDKHPSSESFNNIVCQGNTMAGNQGFAFTSTVGP